MARLGTWVRLWGLLQDRGWLATSALRTRRKTWNPVVLCAGPDQGDWFDSQCCDSRAKAAACGSLSASSAVPSVDREAGAEHRIAVRRRNRALLRWRRGGLRLRATGPRRDLCARCSRQPKARRAAVLHLQCQCLATASNGCAASMGSRPTACPTTSAPNGLGVGKRLDARRMDHGRCRPRTASTAFGIRAKCNEIQ